MNNQSPHKTFLERYSLYIFLVITAVFILLLLVNRPLYDAVIQEDSLAEWLTFGFLVIAGIISLIIGIRIRQRYDYFHWFFLLFFGFNILAGLEEISWGQRVFDMKTEGVFAKYSDQNEINLHNTMQGMARVKTKHIAMYSLFFYGLILPWLVKKGKIRHQWISNNQLIIPPMFLRGGFLIATLFILDFPSGREEEIGEMLYSICFVVMMLHNLHLLKNTNSFDPALQESQSNKIPSLSE